MKKVSLSQIKELNPCSEGYKWAGHNMLGEKKNGESVGVLVSKLMEEGKFSWANWLVTRLMTKDESTRYAIFAARQVLGIFEKEFPKDKRPRLAIEAAEAYLKDPSEESRLVAVRAAADAVDAAWVADAADAAARAAWAAADAAADAAWAAAEKKMQIKILKQGVKILAGRKA